MSEKVFFGKHFIGKRVEFDEEHHSTWTLVEKLSERNDQALEVDYQNYGALSAAWALFVCKNANNPDERAIMKIYMQIPYAGSEFEVPEEKECQASAKLTGSASSELESLKRLRECDCAPTLLAHKTDEQDRDGLVPKGFILYLLMNQLPGFCLGSLFWNLESSEREEIRQKFRDAWKNCVDAGVVNYEALRDNLLWVGDLKKIYIVGFRDARPAKSSDRWRDIVWIEWGLAAAPSGYRWYEETKEELDTSTWAK